MSEDKHNNLFKIFDKINYLYSEKYETVKQNRTKPDKQDKQDTVYLIDEELINYIYENYLDIVDIINQTIEYDKKDNLAAFKISGSGSVSALFRTHPPLEDRIARLQKGY